MTVEETIVYNCFFQMEGDLQTEHTKEAKKFHHPSLQTI
jgi:hypothetical protein